MVWLSSPFSVDDDLLTEFVLGLLIEGASISLFHVLILSKNTVKLNTYLPMQYN